ncbi:MAG: hypothetical protein PVH61_30590 [Candidatus Aminicenantes bacterium]|jgi:hypothetical protein
MRNLTIDLDPSKQDRAAAILESASSSGTHCYLGTHNQKNIRFYEKYGFKVINEGKVPKHGLHVWAMLREP